MKKFKNKETGVIYTVITQNMISVFENNTDFLEMSAKKEDKKSEDKKSEDKKTNNKNLEKKEDKKSEENPEE